MGHFLLNITFSQLAFFPLRTHCNDLRAFNIFFIPFFVHLTFGNPDGKAFQAFKCITAFCMVLFRETYTHTF